MTKPTPRRWLGPAAAALLLVAGAIRTPAGAADPAMIEAARKEGSVVWYSGMIVNQIVRPIADGFEKKYPGIKVQASRLSSSDAALKIINEARAGKPQADIFDGSALVYRLQAANTVEDYRSPSAASFPPGSRDANGAWTAFNTYIMTPAVNTDLVSEAETPRKLTDLLDPKWQGKIAWTNDPTSAGPPGFIGAVLSAMGEPAGMDFLRKLARQHIVNVPASQRVVLDQVISGQYSIALMTFDNHSVISAAEGAPVKFLPLSPAVELPNPGGLVKNAPHPNAARLLLDYILSPEGQAVFRNTTYMPANPAVAPKDPTLLPSGGTFTSVVISPDETAAKLEGWTKIYNDLFK